MPADHGRGGALLVGYRKDDLARIHVANAWILGGKCVGCGGLVYVNESGARFLRGRGDVDLACYDCERRYAAEIVQSL